MAPKKGSTKTVKTRPPINLQALQSGKVAPTDMGRYRRTRGARDEQQQAIDKIVDLAWREWKNTGLGADADWNDVPGTFLQCPEADYDSLKFLVEKAGRFYHFKVTFGRIEKEDVQLEDENGAPLYVTTSGEFATLDSGAEFREEADADGLSAHYLPATEPYVTFVFTATDRPAGESEPENDDEDENDDEPGEPGSENGTGSTEA
jgi:hypothetical protein